MMTGGVFFTIGSDKSRWPTAMKASGITLTNVGVALLSLQQK